MGAEIIRSGTGDVVSLGSYAAVETVWPFHPDSAAAPSIAPMSVNDNSLVTRLVFGDTRALFCGDIGNSAEDEILVHIGGGLNSQIMSVPHHGSRYSSGSGFIGAVSPKTAVAEVGKNNYGHPSPEIIKRYAESGAGFFRTDSDGMIKILCSRDGSYKISDFNGYDNMLAWRRHAYR
jgi:beta-lactamase superfamily II metal-dependent hydrolase